ncbi:MAG: hypothetical protein V7K25_11675 [Nostoc sp.]
MRAFTEAYPDEELVQQPVTLISWGHNVRILDTVKGLPNKKMFQN